MLVERSAQALLKWSWWRRWHQAWARYYHYRARAEKQAEQARIQSRQQEGEQPIDVTEVEKQAEQARIQSRQQEGEQPIDVTEVVYRRLAAVLEGKRGGRPPRHERRVILEAILHVMRTECGWEQLPEDYPPWKTVHWHYTKWRKSGIWEAIWAGLSKPSPPQ